MDREVSKEQIGTVVSIIVAGKAPYDVVQGFIDKYKDAPSRKRRKKGKNDLPPHHYRVTLGSTAMPTYADLKSAYDWVSDAWDESKFKLELHESLRNVTPSMGDKVVFLKKFDRKTTSEKAIEWGKSHGYRLSFPAEREAFSKANPDLQRKFWIVDLGSFIVVDGDRGVPVLFVDGGGRRGLDVDWFDRGWHAGHRFLFVRE